MSVQVALHKLEQKEVAPGAFEEGRVVGTRVRNQEIVRE